MPYKLYYSPGACSLSPHIVLREGGADFTLERVNLKDKVTENGADFWAINAKGSVPALQVEGGYVLTEGPAIVQYIADHADAATLAPVNGTLERSKLQELLNFITSELHKGFSPLFAATTPAEYKPIAKERLEKQFGHISRMLGNKPYLMGDAFTVADAYLFTVSRWSKAVGVDLANWPNLVAFMDRMHARPAVQAALQAEGLVE
jgi:glutathione S-transferase